jgi:nucleoside-diphosphate-sugar epimerase
MIAHPVEVTQSIINTTQNVLELARRCSIKSMVYLSSMEVYGDINCSYGSRVSETELGNIDILNTRSCYPLGKRMAENICYSYYKEYGIPVKIARLAQTFGRGILPTDNRVFAQFARAARDGKNIVLNTKGNSMGNYCGMEDAIAGIMTILVHGTDGEAYNVVNEVNTMTIRQMAELVCNEISGGKIVVEYDIPKENPLGFAPDTGLRLSGQKLEALGWKPRKHLLDMYKDLIADMR